MAEADCSEKQQSLIQRVETMASVIELLLETLKDLSDGDFKKVKQFLLSQIAFDRPSSNIPWRLLMSRDKQDTVFLMVLIYGPQYVEMIKEDLKYLKRTVLEKCLPLHSPGPKKKHSNDRPALIQKVATMAAVKRVLLETLDDFRKEELQKFKEFLELIVSRKKLQGISCLFSNTADTVDKMVETYGQHSVDLTREVVTKMNRTDLMRRLSTPSSELKEKHSVDEHQAALSERATTAAVKQILTETLDNLSIEELEKFKWLLQFTYFKKSLPQISWTKLDQADTADALVHLMVGNQQSVEIAKEVLMDMNMIDQVERLSETSSGPKEKRLSKPIQKEATQVKLLDTLKDLSSKELEQYKGPLQCTVIKKAPSRISRQRWEIADRVEMVKMMMEANDQHCVKVTSSGSKRPSRSLELEGCGRIIQVSRDWTKLNPEVISNDADEAPIYSLQSEAGTFECSVSGLCWICKGKVSFKYQFCSLEEHMESIKRQQYMPAGPLMDITVIAGKLDEVYLPHWICIDDNPTILDKFAVLHVDDCGNVVEKVSEVTSSHVKLCEPVFSLKMVLVRYGFPVEVNCNVLIYKANTAFLTLRVYLIPRDPGLQQELDKRELLYGCKVIPKPYPEKSLKMNDCFILTTDLDGAEIAPGTLMLRYENTYPNFFEVFIKDPDTNFKLKLTKENERQPVWTCTIRNDEYQRTVHVQGEHFVDEHRAELIDRVSNIASIMDELLNKKVISQATYDDIRAIPTNRNKMRKLYSGPLNSAGRDGKEVFYKLLEKHQKYLMDELKKKR